jgi:hypothetical protein
MTPIAVSTNHALAMDPVFAPYADWVAENPRGQ